MFWCEFAVAHWPSDDEVLCYIFIALVDDLPCDISDPLTVRKFIILVEQFDADNQADLITGFNKSCMEWILACIYLHFWNREMDEITTAFTDITAALGTAWKTFQQRGVIDDIDDEWFQRSYKRYRRLQGVAVSSVRNDDFILRVWKKCCSVELE